MDYFAEQLVKKENTTKDDMKRACIIIIAITVIIISILLIFMGLTIAIFLSFGAIWALFYFLKMLRVEYEYSCTNGILDIDKILGKSKRKEMLSIEVKNFTVYGKAGTCPEEDEDNALVTFSAIGISVSNSQDDEEYYAEFEHPEYGKCCLYFTPSSELRSVIEPFLPRELKMKKNK
ncbi:MAG: hypothetical protein K2G88_08365 [Oscillospiraceae bacterium]|nr:hypothetical protein [Oscillospiraceae bacterium]MDE6657255.1 hypothetical protein [Oscillospiraceae bacterium]